MSRKQKPKKRISRKKKNDYGIITGRIIISKILPKVVREKNEELKTCTLLSEIDKAGNWLSA